MDRRQHTDTLGQNKPNEKKKVFCSQGGRELRSQFLVPERFEGRDAPWCGTRQKLCSSVHSRTCLAESKEARDK